MNNLSKSKLLNSNNEHISIESCKILLSKKGWLKDDTIDEYMKVLQHVAPMREEYYFKTNGFMKQLRKSNIKSERKLKIDKPWIFPVNIYDSHWILGKIEFEKKKIIIYNSTPSQNDLRNICKKLKQINFKGIPNFKCESSKWHYEQKDTHNCGIYTVMTARSIGTNIDKLFKFKGAKQLGDPQELRNLVYFELFYKRLIRISDLKSIVSQFKKEYKKKNNNNNVKRKKKKKDKEVITIDITSSSESSSEYESDSYDSD